MPTTTIKVKAHKRNGRVVKAYTKVLGAAKRKFSELIAKGNRHQDALDRLDRLRQLQKSKRAAEAAKLRAEMVDKVRNGETLLDKLSGYKKPAPEAPKNSAYEDAKIKYFGKNYKQRYRYSKAVEKMEAIDKARRSNKDIWAAEQEKHKQARAKYQAAHDKKHRK